MPGRCHSSRLRNSRRPHHPSSCRGSTGFREPCRRPCNEIGSPDRRLYMMLFFSLLLSVGADPDDGLAKKMLPIYQKEAEAYSLVVESAPKKALELKKEPVFEWLNPIRDGVQQGVIFMWLREGRPAAVGCIFSQPHWQKPGRKVLHELHTLAPEKLVVTRDAHNQWKPEAGLARKELAGAAAPAETPVARLIQMKKLAQEFAGYEIDGQEKKRLELRLLPTPLYRYPVGKNGVIDGAIFALLSDAGTDPEVLLLIEARESDGKVNWEYVCARFSDRELHVQRKDNEVFSSIPGETNTTLFGPQQLYRLYPDKVVTSDGKLIAWVRPTPEKPWGEIFPVDRKAPPK